MEFAEDGDLFDLIVSNKKLKEDQAALLFSNIILGLEYLHSKKRYAHFHKSIYTPINVSSLL